MKKLWLLFIVYLYRKYINCIYIPIGSEFHLKKERTATVKPVLSLWIHSNNRKPYKIFREKFEYGSDEVFEEFEINNKVIGSLIKARKV